MTFNAVYAPGCPRCEGSPEPGWVCEEHTDKPWGHDGCGGAGVPCVCNPLGAMQWVEVFPDTEPDLKDERD